MSDQNTDFTSPEDKVIREGLSRMYAAPADSAYWSDLQIRVLSRIADSDPGLWWMFLGRWARAGIAAAALALMTAGIVSIAGREAENQVAYQSVLEERVPVTTMERVKATVGISEEEAALRYVLSITEGAGR